MPFSIGSLNPKPILGHFFSALMSNHDYLGEFEHIFVLALLRLGDHFNVRRQCAIRSSPFQSPTIRMVTQTTAQVGFELMSFGLWARAKTSEPVILCELTGN